MTFNQLVSKIAKREGKKKQVSVGNIREVMKIFFDLYSSEDDGHDVVGLLNDESSKRELKALRSKK